MQNEIGSIYVKPDFLGQIYSTGSVEQRTIYIHGKSRIVRAYAATSDRVASFTIYAPVSRSEGTVHAFDQLELKNPQLVAIPNTVGTGRDRNKYLEYVVLVDGASLSNHTNENEVQANTDESLGQRLLGLKFKGGDVTAVIDIDQTFGKFLYLGHEPVFKYDEETDARTEELIGYEVIVISSQTKKPYKVKFDHVEVDFTALRLRDEVVLVHPTFRFYQDSSSTTQGSTISIGAAHVKRVKRTTALKGKAAQSPQTGAQD